MYLFLSRILGEKVMLPTHPGLIQDPAKARLPGYENPIFFLISNIEIFNEECFTYVLKI